MGASAGAIPIDAARVLAGLARAARGAGPDWHEERRAAAASRVVDLGLPGSKVEHWRETSVRPLITPAWAGADQADGRAPEPWGELGLRRIGRGLPPVEADGLWAGPLPEAPPPVARLAREHLGRLVPTDGEVFAALGVAAGADPLVIHVADGADAGTLQVVRHYPAADEPRLGAAHLLVLAGRGAACRVVETHTGAGGAPRLVVPVTELHAGPGARVAHVMLQALAETAFGVGTLGIHQLDGSRVVQHLLAFGGALARQEIHARLAGHGADCRLLGLMLARGTQHLDARTLIDHAVPEATSHENYKAILRDRARSVFAGWIVVRKGAQQTDARQQNDNLVLSRDALARTRPQLEIYADDVRCSHGATVGRLDGDALFYLRARGVPLAEARRMLIRAFAAAVIDEIPCAPLVEQCEREIDARIPGTEEEIP